MIFVLPSLGDEGSLEDRRLIAFHFLQFNVTFNRNTNLTTLVHANGLPLGVNWTNNAAAGTPAPAYVSLENTGDSNSAVR